MLENIVYFELRRKGYEVYIDKNETKEIKKELPDVPSASLSRQITLVSSPVDL